MTAANQQKIIRYLLLGLVLLGLFLPLGQAFAADPAAATSSASLPTLSINLGGETEDVEQVSTAVKILALLTVLSLAPALMITLTSFTRIVIVLSFMRQALGTNQAPPNQVMIGLALFMTYFIMSPVLNTIYDTAYIPYVEQQISVDQALTTAAQPLRGFMLQYTREADLGLFLEASNGPKPQTVDEIPMSTLVPAFMISELKTAFQIGFMIYLPFLVIDIVVASILLAMGMMMLPPIMISLPIKLLLFVLVDGWNLLASALLGTFH